MNKREFAEVMVIIKAAYPGSNLIPDEMSKNLWFEMLKDLEYDSVLKAVRKHIQTSPFVPTIADIRRSCEEMKFPVWSREWMRLLNGAKSRELNEPGQYAMKILTRDYFESCRENAGRLGQCMKEFEKFYKEYVTMSAAVKKQFAGIPMFQAPVTAITGGQGDGP